MKRGLILLLIIGLSLFASGCGNQTELNRLGIVSATAFDLDETNQWILTFQLIKPQSTQGKSGGGGSQSPVIVFSTKGKTILEAVQKSKLESSRRLFFSHSRVVIISQRVAEFGLNQLLDSYIRDNQTRETANVLIASGEAKKVLEILTPLENNPGISISNLISGQGDGQSTFIPSTVHELIFTITQPSASAALPEIKIAGDEKRQTSLDALKETRNPAVLKLDRVGVFKQDKFAGWLTRNESLGIPWITNRIKNTTVVFPCEGENRKDQLSSFLVETSRTKLKPAISDGKLLMTVDIHAKGNLTETACKLDIKKPETLNKLEKHIQEQIKKDVEHSFQALKKLKADALGFGNAFHKAYPQAWKKWSKNWGNEFPKISMNVTVKVTIQRTGMINDSFPKISGKTE
ncbi:Ger(x)C family spore germination protein [Paenibacillus prosopidis]|uniref:Spore germination protein KC n=1 Tax=Paenibacillus prosopidis TaxID=630520 RepID=A0A368VUC9_9BACL|nr:Ger(x)C family spore germination protein [Paenibacillus prosopidis]RCW43063.1 spore germination protein KC [Paenibacillus prosopidis]